MGKAKSKTFTVTAKEWAEIHVKGVEASVMAVEQDPRAYTGLKRIVNYALTTSIDIDEWIEAANQVTMYLDRLSKVAKGTYFYHPLKNISPNIYGKANTFRARCRELSELFEELDKHIAT